VIQAVGLLVPEVAMRVQHRRADRTERGLWRELSCCILSSQVPYSIACTAADRIDAVGLLWQEGSADHECLTFDLRTALSVPFAINGQLRRYRFPNAKAKQIALAHSTVRRLFGGLCSLLEVEASPRQVRSLLTRELLGVGPKQASMFLRNIGFSYDLAVLDRHILRYMRLSGLSKVSVGRLNVLRVYEGVESVLVGEACRIGCTVGILDWAIWIVMRAAGRAEFT